LCGTTKKQIKYKGRNGLEKNKQNAHNKLRQFANKKNDERSSLTKQNGNSKNMKSIQSIKCQDMHYVQEQWISIDFDIRANVKKKINQKKKILQNKTNKIF